MGQDQHFPCHLRVRFPTRDLKEHLQAEAMVDSGNCMPGSAVISEKVRRPMGVQDLFTATNTQIFTASEDGWLLQVIRKLHHLNMAVSHTMVLHLHHVTVVKNLSHPVNLSGYFLREFNTQLCFDMQPPCLWIQGEYIPLGGVLATAEAVEEEIGYNVPLPGPIPELPQTIENGTHWVDPNLNANKGPNLLAMSVPPVPDSSLLDLLTEFPEISDPPDTILTEDTFLNGRPCPPGPIQGWPPDAEPVKSRPVESTLYTATPPTNHPARFAMAKRVTLPGYMAFLQLAEIQLGVFLSKCKKLCQKYSHT